MLTSKVCTKKERMTYDSFLHSYRHWPNTSLAVEALGTVFTTFYVKGKIFVFVFWTIKSFCSRFFLLKNVLGSKRHLISFKSGRTVFPDNDLRPDFSNHPSEIDYHQDFVDNRNGYNNFIGLCSFYLSRKLRIF